MIEAGEQIGLLDCLREVQLVVRRFQEDTKRASLEIPLEHLKAAVRSLDVPKVARPPVGLDEYARQWQEYLDGKLESIAARAVRNLCWHPETATSDTFQYYLKHENHPLGSRALQGLVRSCHAHWSQGFAAGNAAMTVRKRLEEYDGPSRLLGKWKEAPSMLLGLGGAERFGDAMVEGSVPVKAFCQTWGILDEVSPYVKAAVAHASEACQRDLDRVPRLLDYLLGELLPWQGWQPDRFKEEVRRTVLHPGTRDERVRQAVSHFVLQDPRLGDPRLPLNQPNWAGIREAERAVVEWQSQFDIVFFFEYVLPKGKDPHGRKEFWLRYVKRVIRSRPLLNWDDRIRLETVLRAKREQSREFGRIDAHTSAFLLDFGKIVVVEFSAPGNACYVYNESEFRKIVADFWAHETFGVARLKQKTSSLTKQSRFYWNGVHRAGWQQDASHLLALYGVRPY
ncbi:MAG TPA: EH signature domain-containing protein [Terriglobia bacterium]|nr:EH signature domain-containing protein [Terriglobia bacterium]